MAMNDGGNTPAGEGGDRERLGANIARMEELSQRFLAALSARRTVAPGLSGPAPDFFLRAATAYWAEMARDPARIMEHQIAYWGTAVTQFVEAQQALASGRLKAPDDPGPKDPRFSNPLWDSHPWFNYVKRQYLASSSALEQAVDDLENVDERDRKRIKYFTRQIIDLMSPTNFLGTNPDALEKAVATDGDSLVKGLENLVADVERNRGELLVSLADRNAFSVGQNIAASRGSVVFRNHMFELIQYAPTTAQVHAKPLLLFPPWINKFYILDLKPQNSLIRWLVDQGFTLFVISWVNPDASYRNTGMDTYVKDGYLTALDEVARITGEPDVNVIGYCIAGTTLALMLALLEKWGEGDRIRSATFFTTLTDFSDQGEFTPFLDDSFIDAIEEQVAEDGILDSFFMSRTFSYLRPNDLIYGPAIRSYLMGEAPPAFDLLYWNGDGTNLPARMAVEYLRWLCQENRFAQGRFELLGETVSLSDVKAPLFAIACEGDHIAAWRSSFDGIRQMGSTDKTFVLSQSGHIAGIVNPPSKKKYGHYTSPLPMEDAAAWRAAAEFHEGSWWPRWATWLGERSGEMVPARVPGSNDRPPLAEAPGTYVAARGEAA